MIWIAIVAAVAAGAALAAEGLLQQGEVSEGPADESAKQMLARLLRDKRWWAGLGSAGAAYGFQAVALAFGPLSLVQPVIVSEMLFAIPIAARRHGVRLGPREWLSVAAVVGGLAAGIGLASPREGDPLAPRITEWAWALGGVGLITLAVLGLTRVISGTARASLFALAGATMLALQSALFDAAIRLLSNERFGVFTHWQAYALIVVSLLGLWLIQRAYKAGPLPASLPIIDAVLPIGAIALGMGLFNETINTRWWGLTGAGVGLTLLIAGIVSLDTSGAVRMQQKIEDREKKEQAEDDGAGEERAEARHQQ
jgi:hypothetical protein